MKQYFILLIILVLFGCGGEFSAIDFKRILDDSINHSSVSYWYAGEKNGYHFIQERWLLSGENKTYRISNSEIEVTQSFEYTENQSEWINLKKGDVIFKD